MARTKEYLEGYEAAWDRQTVEANPYFDRSVSWGENDSKEFGDWNAGWIDGGIRRNCGQSRELPPLLPPLKPGQKRVAA